MCIYTVVSMQGGSVSELTVLLSLSCFLPMLLTLHVFASLVSAVGSDFVSACRFGCSLRFRLLQALQDVPVSLSEGMLVVWIISVLLCLRDHFTNHARELRPGWLVGPTCLAGFLAGEFLYSPTCRFRTFRPCLYRIMAMLCGCVHFFSLCFSTLGSFLCVLLHLRLIITMSSFWIES